MTRRMMWAALLCAALAGGPAHATAPAPAAEEMLPTPYTAEQIHANSPAGHMFRFRVEQGGKVVLHQTRFLTSTAEGAEVEVSTMDEQGKVLETSKAKVTWADLQGHARFPKSSTTTTEEKVTTGLGTFDATVYHVTDPTGKRLHFVFARSRPGPPVKYWAEADGRTIMSAEMVAYE